MPIHNKLVRDRIPEIIKSTGKLAVTKILDEEEYVTELRRKSKEELDEFLNSETNEEALEELADLLEIIHALAKVHAANIDKVEQIRLKKAEERGSFDERIFLIEVLDE
ncbi:MAG: nucleoside triphosphate pyrophosphohydrolase [Caldibacillus thermoamylovorans]|jgi:predicted house-cleaning noncanonical NTP pyrophosphatase (MazG superfamily)|uniref:nucleoside triphosphate pyrophosphohydrolase n=1 Tax=Caldifermentibacillus hisashii TaxID=996558 RepID=UPI000BA4D554|nr:nucleoside triphosphate pyrophosphohydrolase [Caldifermentibacillus hisashii]MDL0420751.1 nucleoside triphosphate pyrophosphohydrolase [Caldibacillus thermoamylovorans]MED3642129.1 nucleoside triphosphate pyrophosphohydrolase [Caldifermentibacillus hisashii]PAC34295.1 phosphoribosyl-ATP pyrophosphohydrolase [Caldifermentibacillus hisashii]